MPRESESARALRSGVWASLCSWLLTACSGDVTAGQAVGKTSARVVYDQDERVEAYEAPSQLAQRIAAQSVVALIDDAALGDRAGETPWAHVFDVPTLRERTGVCDDTRFAEQPAPVSCSGVLVANDLILTAGHCARRIPCQSLNIAFGVYYRSASQLEPLGPDDWYRCAEVVLVETPNVLSALDYAFVRLDRTVSRNARPLQLETYAQTMTVGDELVLLGFSQGLPLKVQPSVRVTDGRPDSLDYFVTDADAFSGDSGAPLLDAKGRVLGILANGRDDYGADLRNCQSNAVHTAAEAAERATYAFQARAALCQAPELGSGLCTDAAELPVNAGAGCAFTTPGRTAPGPNLALAAACAALAFARFAQSRRPRASERAERSRYSLRRRTWE